MNITFDSQKELTPITPDQLVELWDLKDPHDPDFDRTRVYDGIWGGPTKIRIPEVSGESLEQTAARVSLELAKASGYIVLDDDDNETAPGEVVRAARCHQPDS